MISYNTREATTTTANGYKFTCLPNQRHDYGGNFISIERLQRFIFILPHFALQVATLDAKKVNSV